VRGARFSLAAASLLLLAAAGLLLFRPKSAPQRVVINDTPVPPVPSLDAEQVARGAELYAENCAACHGANMQGAPDWKRRLPDDSLPPPPHDDSGHTWHHPDRLLLEIITAGGDPDFNSKMPAFGAKLTAREMGSILEFIKNSWDRESREFQWWITVTSGGE